MSLAPPLATLTWSRREKFWKWGVHEMASLVRPVRVGVHGHLSARSAAMAALDAPAQKGGGREAMRTLHVFMLCATWLLTHALRDFTEIYEASAQVELAHSLKTIKPSVAAPNEESKL